MAYKSHIFCCVVMNIFSIELFWVTLAPSYYGLMYALAFLSGYFILWKQKTYSQVELESLFLYMFLWVLLWGRIGYVIFYNPALLIDFRSELPFWWALAVHEWGMSFHGWLIWVSLALIYFSKKYSRPLLDSFDTIAPLAALGIFFGRIGNYINKELLGFPYEWPLAVVTSEWSFFPSPLFQALTEWFMLFMILIFVSRKKGFRGQVASVFLIGYWVFRTFTELFIRMPDAHIGYHFWFLTHGSLLSIPTVSYTHLTLPTKRIV